MSRIRDIASILTASSDMATDVEVATAVSNHSAASDPHTGYVLESLIDAKGDLIVGSADNTVARLATGNSGESIVADSSTSTGLRYQSAYNGNAVINSCTDIWQRGTSFTSAGFVYTADRWQFYPQGASNRDVSRQNAGSTLPTIQYCARVGRQSANTATTAMYFGQNLESAQSYQFAGQAVTVSFYARKGANYSAASDILGFGLFSGTGTDQNVFSGYTGQATVINNNATLTTSWQRFSFTGTVASTATELAMYFVYTPVGTAGAADYYEVTGIQLELGSVATTIKRAGGTIQGELAACQRYYEKSYAQATAPQTNTTVNRVNIANHFGSATGISSATVFLKVTKRSTPTITLYRSDGSATNPNYWEYTVGTTETYANPTVANTGDNNFSVGFNGTASGTANNATLIRGHFVAEAEL